MRIRRSKRGALASAALCFLLAAVIVSVSAVHHRLGSGWIPAVLIAGTGLWTLFTREEPNRKRPNE